jgi:hypothetical protein
LRIQDRLDRPQCGQVAGAALSGALAVFSQRDAGG